ncbi:hypothetical protein EIMP300_19760 [Escherichia coli]|uniref:EamA domain-containing protein n=1 Tax=Escherichia coli TaxID=562 RepID=A0A8S0FKW9_ECOLX|nr:hypothetical protein EIMP300_19760 [Escherichia coli]
MKQQAGIGILLALTTAICWGALPIAMKQVLEVMEPPTIVFYRFLMASIGLGAIRTWRELRCGEEAVAAITRVS